MRKAMSMVICTALVLCITVTPAFASSENDEIVVESKSEYEYITELQGCSEEELSELGYSNEEIAELYAFSFEEALCERAQLPEAQLRGLGYDDDEIIFLKQNADDPELLAQAAAALGATCTGRITLVSGCPAYIKFRYAWEWDHCPLMLLEDRAAVGFVGVREGSFKAVQGSQSASTCMLTQVTTTAQNITTTKTITCENFEVRSYGATCVYTAGMKAAGYVVWISDGYMEVMVNRISTNYSLDALYVVGKVAHKTVQFTLTPSVTFGGETWVAVDFSVGLGYVYDEVAYIDGHIGGVSKTNQGSKEDRSNVDFWNDSHRI